MLWPCRAGSGGLVRLVGIGWPSLQNVLARLRDMVPMKLTTVTDKLLLPGRPVCLCTQASTGCLSAPLTWRGGAVPE